MTKIVVDEMPKTPDDCPFMWHSDLGLWCDLAEDSCNDCDSCIYLTTRGVSNEKSKDIPMSPNDYQQACLRTESVPDIRNQYARILQGLMGLSGEAGECVDVLKKVLFQGHELDNERLAKELGDVAWYLAVSADAIGYKLETIFKMNIEKLNKRYPNGFEANKSINRVEGDV